MRAVREIAHRLRVARRMPSIEHLQVFDMQRSQRQRERLAEEFATGYLSGWRECYEACMAAVNEELACLDEVWEVDALLAETPKSLRKN
jgi:flagellar biosynthesis/type III secretory pathway protein FliH